MCAWLCSSLLLPQALVTVPWLSVGFLRCSAGTQIHSLLSTNMLLSCGHLHQDFRVSVFQRPTWPSLVSCYLWDGYMCPMGERIYVCSGVVATTTHTYTCVNTYTHLKTHVHIHGHLQLPDYLPELHIAGSRAPRQTEKWWPALLSLSLSLSP